MRRSRSRFSWRFGSALPVPARHTQWGGETAPHLPGSSTARAQAAAQFIDHYGGLRDFLETNPAVAVAHASLFCALATHSCSLYTALWEVVVRSCNNNLMRNISPFQSCPPVRVQHLPSFPLGSLQTVPAASPRSCTRARAPALRPPSLSGHPPLIAPFHRRRRPPTGTRRRRRPLSATPSRSLRPLPPASPRRRSMSALIQLPTTR